MNCKICQKPITKKRFHVFCSKECRDKDRVLRTKEWRKKFPEKSKMAVLNWGKRNPEKVRAYVKKAYKKFWKTRYYPTQQKYRKEKEREKDLVRTWTLRQLKKLKITKSCAICGTRKNIENHHMKYEKDLTKIIFMCRNCHKKFHRNSGGNLNGNR